MTGRERIATRCRRSLATRPATARRARWRGLLRRAARSSAASGTTRLAASVGVEARRVGDEVEQGGVDVVADGADDGGAGGGHGSQQALVAERQQVLDGATAAADDDDVDGGVARRAPAGRPLTSAAAVGSLHRDLPDRRSAPWASGAGRSPRRPSRQRSPGRRSSPTVRGRNGRGFLRSASNRPSAASIRLRCSSRASSSPTPTGRIWRASSWRVPRWVQNIGLACTTTRAPSVTRRGHGVEGVDLDRDRERHVDVGVAQGEVCRAGARPAGELDHLPLDPQHGHLLDVLGDLQAEQPDRPRMLGGGVGRLLRQRRRRWSRTPL